MRVFEEILRSANLRSQDRTVTECVGGRNCTLALHDDQDTQFESEPSGSRFSQADSSRLNESIALAGSGYPLMEPLYQQGDRDAGVLPRPPIGSVEYPPGEIPQQGDCFNLWEIVKANRRMVMLERDRLDELLDERGRLLAYRMAPPGTPSPVTRSPCAPLNDASQELFRAANSTIPPNHELSREAGRLALAYARCGQYILNTAPADTAQAAREAFVEGVTAAINALNRRIEVQALHLRAAQARLMGSEALFVGYCGQWTDLRRYR